jgi:DNA-directed RNA polymerase subunit M/transcription elongation factor TFIIS
MIRYHCPSCKTLLESPDHKVGTKVACPTCEERLRVPMPSNGHMVPAPSSRKKDYPVLEEIEEDEPRDDVDDEDDRPRRNRSRSKRKFKCRECGSRRRPVERTEISQNGWILFIVLLIVFWPLCFIGLCQKETYEVCDDCGARLKPKRGGSTGLGF